MRRKAFVPALCALLFALSVPASVQQPTKVARIGFLDPSNGSVSAALRDAFRQELRKRGWIEGKNISIEYRFAERKIERLPEIAADLVRLGVDLIMAVGGPPALAAKKATKTIPIVMALGGDPVRLGLVASLAPAGRQCHGARESITRAKHEKA